MLSMGDAYAELIQSLRAQRDKHGQNISYMDAEIIGSYFEEMLQTSRPLV